MPPFRDLDRQSWRGSRTDIRRVMVVYRFLAVCDVSGFQDLKQEKHYRNSHRDQVPHRTGLEDGAIL